MKERRDRKKDCERKIAKERKTKRQRKKERHGKKDRERKTEKNTEKPERQRNRTFKIDARMKSVKKNDTKEPSVTKTSDDTTYKTQVTGVYNLISRVFPPGKISPSRLPATKFLFPSMLRIIKCGILCLSTMAAIS